MDVDGRLRAMVLAAITLCAGCGGGNAPASADAGGGDPVAFAEKYCDLFIPCCTDLALPPGPNCRSIVTSTATGVGRVREFGDRCLADLQALLQRLRFCDIRALSVPSCQQVLVDPTVPHGSVALGGACQLDSDCTAPSTGETVCEVFSNRCQERIRGAAGDTPCIGTRDVLGISSDPSRGFVSSGFICDNADGLFCDLAIDACAPLRRPGQSCADSYARSCEATAFCDGSQCMGQIALGGSCASAAGGCVEGAFCDGTPMTCRSAFPVGTACSTSEQCLTGNCEAGLCRSRFAGLGYLCGAM